MEQAFAFRREEKAKTLQSCVVTANPLSLDRKAHIFEE